MKNLGLIFFGPWWDNNQRRRKQQIAYRLSNTKLIKKVVFVERSLTISSLVKLLFGKGDRTDRMRWKRVIKNKSFLFYVTDTLSVLSPPAIIPYMVEGYYGMISEKIGLFYELILSNYLRKIKEKYYDLDWVIFVSHPLLSITLIKNIHDSGCCYFWYDYTEDFSLFPNLTERQRKIIKINTDTLIKISDCASFVSPNHLEQYGK